MIFKNRKPLSFRRSLRRWRWHFLLCLRCRGCHLVRGRQWLWRSGSQRTKLRRAVRLSTAERFYNHTRRFQLRWEIVVCWQHAEDRPLLDLSPQLCGGHGVSCCLPRSASTKYFHLRQDTFVLHANFMPCREAWLVRGSRSAAFIFCCCCSAWIYAPWHVSVAAWNP